ncbi:MAG: ROK family protein [Marinilabiliales bacterium]
MKSVVVGIDIGGTNTDFGLIDVHGNCIAKDSFLTNSFPVFQDYIKHLATKIEKLYEKFKNKYKLEGIGIGAPNGNIYNGTIEFAPNLAWQGVVQVTQHFKNYFDVPVVLTNDANAAARGEMIYGGAIDMKDFIVITLGTGLGSGFVVNGDIMYGHDGFAGELGHTIVDPEGRLCGCGKKGCLETYVSATGIKRTVVELLAKTGKPSILRSKNLDTLSGKDIDDAARAGDPVAIEAFDYTGKILGMKLSDAVAITSPEAIFLHGGLANAKELIFEPTKRYMEKYLLPIYRNKVKLLPTKIKDSNAAIIGAAALIWNKNNE